MHADEEALAEVAADDLFGLADRGEIGACVPAEQEIEIGAELGIEVGGYDSAGEIRFE
jgi:hypothetical protein